MLDNLHSPDGRSENGRQQNGREQNAAPMSDREVPIGRRRTPASVHQWLDGEMPETEVRRGDTARDVEFWSRIAEQSATRRQMRTPAHLQAQIMAALPTSAPAVDVERWYSRSIELAPVVAILGGAALVAAGAAIGAAVAR